MVMEESNRWTLDHHGAAGSALDGRSGRDDIAFITHLKHSLKARVTLLTLVISIAGIWSLTLFATQRLQADMVRMQGEQQLSTVSAVAAQVNGAIEDRLRGLEGYAKDASLRK